MKYKNINQIFSSNPDLINMEEVKELIKYCKELEEKVFDSNIDDKYDKELILKDFIKEIYSGISDSIREDKEAERFGFERFDFSLGVKNLKKYIEGFSDDYNIPI